jgi:TPR repeat protein
LVVVLVVVGRRAGAEVFAWPRLMLQQARQVGQQWLAGVSRAILGEAGGREGLAWWIALLPVPLQADAWYNLGVLWHRGWTGQTDLALAKAFYDRALALGSPLAACQLGLMHLRGEGVATDAVQAFALVKRAAEQGLPRAMGVLGVLYRYGQGTRADPTMAEWWLTRATQTGDFLSFQHLGEMAERGEGRARDVPRAISAYQIAAFHGVVPAQLRLGWIYTRGLGIEPNPEQGRHWLEQAAQQGMVAAREYLAEAHAYGYFGTVDVAAALDQARQASAQGSAWAPVFLGSLYESGKATGQPDFPEARRWYELGLARGQPLARRCLGTLLLQGGWPGSDPARGLALLTAAAEQGDLEAMNLLGWRYDNGIGVPRDEAQAVRWFRQAALQGLPVAMANYGEMLVRGAGLARDVLEGIRWLGRAAAWEEPYGCCYLAQMRLEGREIAADPLQPWILARIALAWEGSAETRQALLAIQASAAAVLAPAVVRETEERYRLATGPIDPLQARQRQALVAQVVASVRLEWREPHAARTFGPVMALRVALQPLVHRRLERAAARLADAVAEDQPLGPAECQVVASMARLGLFDVLQQAVEIGDWDFSPPPWEKDGQGAVWFEKAACQLGAAALVRSDELAAAGAPLLAFEMLQAAGQLGWRLQHNGWLARPGDGRRLLRVALERWRRFLRAFPAALWKRRTLVTLGSWPRPLINIQHRLQRKLGFWLPVFRYRRDHPALFQRQGFLLPEPNGRSLAEVEECHAHQCSLIFALDCLEEDEGAACPPASGPALLDLLRQRWTYLKSCVCPAGGVYHPVRGATLETPLCSVHPPLRRPLRDYEQFCRSAEYEALLQELGSLLSSMIERISQGGLTPDEVTQFQERCRRNPFAMAIDLDLEAEETESWRVEQSLDALLGECEAGLW